MKPHKLLFTTLLFALFSLQSFTQIPRTLSYQGVLTDSLGNPKLDGIYTFTFRLYDVTAGGTPFWIEIKDLQLKRGLFSTILGDVTPLDATIKFDKQYYLGIKPGSDPELSPRIPFSSVSYSLNSIKADTARFALAAPQQVFVDSARIAGTVPDNSIASLKIINSTIQRSDVQPSFKSPYADTADYARVALVSGNAGGDLTGTFPNPSIASGVVTSAKIHDSTITATDIATGAVTMSKINQSAATSGQVIKWTGSNWAPGNDQLGNNYWTQNSSTIYYNLGNVGVGTTTPGGILNVRGNADVSFPQLLLTESENDFSRLMFKNTIAPSKTWTIAGKPDATDANSQLNFYYHNGTVDTNLFSLTGSQQAILNGKLGIGIKPTNDILEIYKSDYNYVRMYTEASGLGSGQGFLMGIAGFNAYCWNYENGKIEFGTNNLSRITITAAGNVGIGDATPEATLDVTGTVVVGAGGVIFSEIREITGTLDADGTYVFSYPSGYSSANMRVLSLEVNFNGNAWVGLGSTSSNTTNIEKLFYYLGTNIYIYYPDVASYHNRDFRMIVMKVP